MFSAPLVAKRTIRLRLRSSPPHTHAVTADSREGTITSTTGNYLAKTSDGTTAYGSNPTTAMASISAGNTGGSQPHQNMKPFIALNCIIAVTGIFPSQN